MAPSALIKCLIHQTQYFTIKDALLHIWTLHDQHMLPPYTTKIWCCGRSIGYYGTPEYDEEDMFKHLWAEHRHVFDDFVLILDDLRRLKLIGPEDKHELK
ncbi:hypothetical protein N7454_000907 [Penicillium verhagenii]|nr:hypothetical protein N7454_000907 [Penicillium verhagenii]